MEKIDYSKFRFKIGDTVFAGGYSTKVLGYYFSIEFNDYRYYGYAIEVASGHNGIGLVYNEDGRKMQFDKKNVSLIPEKDVFPYTPFTNAKPGDKVRIRKRIGSESNYQLLFTDEMSELAGEIYIISRINALPIQQMDREFPARYEIYLKGNNFVWSDTMLELLDFSKEEFELHTIDSIKSIIKKDNNSIELKVRKLKPNLKFNL